MKPTLIDTSVCRELLADRPCRHESRILTRADDLYISSLTALALYDAASSLPETEQKSAFAQLDAFIGRFAWVEGDYPTIRKAGQFSASIPKDVPYPMRVNMLLAKARGLTFAVSSQNTFADRLHVPGFDIEIW